MTIPATAVIFIVIIILAMVILLASSPDPRASNRPAQSAMFSSDTETGVALGEYEYLTRDGGFYFRFLLERAHHEIRIYILEQPDYGRRPTDSHSTHRLYDGRHYICIDGPLVPDNVPDALTWIPYWAEATAEYIKSGRSFS